ncbi:hypothetical protein [Pseudomonas folii]|uniref:Uncharacterized protein n=1 Tax=Pseudomonas folii TaxID=2762593 RepID=A0ABR7B1P7_9PSED|nr:hypothetical protein [Pseudomonas folii]
MSETNSVTREKVREWQQRRLEIKDRMQSHPEMVLELSRVLDLMDEEHAAILSGAAGDQADHPYKQNSTLDRTAPAEHSMRSVAGAYDLQLNVVAHTPEGLRKLLEMAVYEMQRQIDASCVGLTGESRKYPGGMSGTLGNYQFELDISNEAGNA